MRKDIYSAEVFQPNHPHYLLNFKSTAMNINNHVLTSDAAFEVKSLSDLRKEGWKFNSEIRSKGNGNFAIAELPSGQRIAIPCAKNATPGEHISGVKFFETVEGITAVGCRNSGIEVS